MKATIDCDPALEWRLKIEAARRARTVKELVAEGIRNVLAGPDKLSVVDPKSGRPAWLGVFNQYGGNAHGTWQRSVRGSVVRQQPATASLYTALCLSFLLAGCGGDILAPKAHVPRIAVSRQVTLVGEQALSTDERQWIQDVINDIPDGNVDCDEMAEKLQTMLNGGRISRATQISGNGHPGIGAAIHNGQGIEDSTSKIVIRVDVFASQQDLLETVRHEFGHLFMHHTLFSEDNENQADEFIPGCSPIMDES